MIRFGPAGIPLSCKGRTLRDGIEDVHNLGLSAMEVQLLRANIQERAAELDEVGLTPRTLPTDMVIEVVRKKGEKEEIISDLDEKIRNGDTLITLASGVAKTYLELQELGAMARELDVKLSIHTPYYMDMVSDGELCWKSMDAIRWGGLIANELGADVVVTHIGLYDAVSERTAMNRVSQRIADLVKWYRRHAIRAKIGLEVSGRTEIFGSVPEILSLCRRIRGTAPVINFAHIHAREFGGLKEPEDFVRVFERIGKVYSGAFYVHFSGVEHEGGNEKRYTPIKKGDLRFEPLAEALIEENYDLTVISSSPLLEHDAMYMKVILERVLAKQVSKELKERKDREEE